MLNVVYYVHFTIMYIVNSSLAINLLYCIVWRVVEWAADLAIVWAVLLVQLQYNIMLVQSQYIVSTMLCQYNALSVPSQ